jgi:acyl-coenzyme A synthetase/AMP-(fatty) acid ligase
MRFGKVLRDLGIQKGDRVLVILPRGTDVYVVSIGYLGTRRHCCSWYNNAMRADIEYRIGPFEVESAVDSHEAVIECAMIPSPDPVRGEIVKVFVVLRDGYEPSEKRITDIQQHVKRITAPYKYPREIEFVNELPKTISGKIKRKELRIMEFERKRDVIENLNSKACTAYTSSSTCSDSALMRYLD